MIQFISPKTPGQILQRRLLALAAAFTILYAMILTFSPAVRYHSDSINLRWFHWLGVLIWLFCFVLLEQIINQRLIDHNPMILPIIGFLTSWGMLSIWRLDGSMGFRQSVWLFVSTGVAVGCLSWKELLVVLRKYKYVWLMAGIILTSLTFLFGVYPSGEGPRLWLDFGGVYLQPSEPLKLLLIVFLAAYLSDRVPVSFSVIQLLLPSFVVLATALAILLAQRDLGTASLFTVLFVMMVYLASGKRRLLIFGLIFLVLAGIIGFGFFDVIHIRVDAWLNPWLDPSGRSYQIVQSLLAIASGSVFGNGPGLGNPGIVPIAHSDFIFSTIAEESGLLGSLALFLLLALFILNGLKIGIKAVNQFQRYLATGITVFISFQSILIIGGNMRLFPLTGVTLPFMSYGGSSLLTSFLCASILLIISQTNEREVAPFPKPLPLQFVGTVLLVALVGLSLSNGWWAVVRSQDLQTRMDNPRRSINEQYSARGDILDSDEQPIVITQGEPGSYQRVYFYPSLSPVTGYDNATYGQSGLESSLNDYLSGQKGNPSSLVWWNHLIYGQPPVGLDVRLSLNLEFQKQADKLMQGHTGALVLLNANSGEILAMSSTPFTDSNLVTEQWATWMADPKSPLLNRATQGQYSLGSAIGPFLVAAVLAQHDTLDPSDASALIVNGEIITCALQQEDPSQFGIHIQNGCPVPIIRNAEELGVYTIEKTFKDFGFLDAPQIQLEVAEPGFLFIGSNFPDFFFGSDQFKITPLQMALASAALSNGGNLVEPRLVSAINVPQQGWIVLSSENPREIENKYTNHAAELLRSAAFPGWETIGYSNSTQGAISWYIAGTMHNWEGTSVALVVVLEEDNTKLVEEIGRELLLSTIYP